MMSKYSFFLLALLFLFGPLQPVDAQNGPEFLNRIGLYTTIGRMNNAKLTNPTLWEFVNTYNNLHAGDLETRAEAPAFDDIRSVSVGAFLHFLDFELGFSQLNMLRSATFRDGRIREIELDGRQNYFNVGVTFPSDIVRIGAFLQMNNSKGTLKSRLIYPDGGYSYGRENRFNGLFDYSAIDLGYGFKASVGFKFVFFTFQMQKVGVDYFGWLFPEDDIGPNAMTDFHGVGGDSGIYFNGEAERFLPTNARNQIYLTTSALDQGLIDPAIAGWRYLMGITFSLTSNPGD